MSPFDSGGAASGATAARATAERRYVLLVATLSSFLTPFMASSINLAIPAIGAEFHAPAVVLNWIVTSYLLASAVFLVPFGRLADLYGRKRVFLVGTGVYALLSLFSGLARSGELLLVCRVFQGIGGAMIFGTGVAILTSVFPVQERGRALGLNTAAVYTGLSLGPIIGGFLTHQVGWRSIFFVNFVLGLVVFFATVTGLKGEWRGARGEKFDLGGAVAYSLSLAAVMVGISTARTLGAASWLFFLGVAGLLGFVGWELRLPHPVLDLRLFRNLVFAFSNLAALINYSATFGVSFLLSLYLQVVKGLDPQRAGFVLLAQPVVMAFLSPFAGRLSDRVEPRLVASLGMFLNFVGLVLFALLRAATALPAVVGELLLMGVGFALFSSPNTNAVTTRNFALGKPCRQR
jgi:EmrB/QacA subfamily drug resistance transporter